ncbi:MAG: sigma-70 family RNA polymerase sigma factor [Phycisphaerales bacterium]|nr:sigma-70 family RNA polymerase sigma factor [Phycisphaerales bacterium]
MTEAEKQHSDLCLDQIHGRPVPEIVVPATGEVVIGRSPECGAQLTNRYVSRKHAVVIDKAGAWVLQDLDSRGGTYLNTIRLEPGEESQLVPGDLLQIGPWKFLVRIGPAAAPLDEEFVTELDKAQKEPPSEVPTLVRTVNGRYETDVGVLLRLKSDETTDREMGWKMFVDRYGPVICGFARNAGLPSGEADDIMQTVLFNFFKAADRFEYDPTKGRFRGYLKRITLNAIRQRHRKRREANLDTKGMRAAQDPHDDLEAEFDRQWAEHLLSEAMQEARPKFEPKTWEAFELYGRRGLSAERTAERLGMTSETVRHAKSRVMRTVREIINRIRDEEL